MAPSTRRGGELSLRHLPDTSDTSFSFQIPAISRGDDYLLADDSSDDFFKGTTEDVLATPLPSRFALDPLTLSQLTPRPSARNHISSPSPPQNQPCRSRPNEDERMIVPPPPPEAQKPDVTQGSTKPRPKLVTGTATRRTTAHLFSNEGSSSAERIENLRVEIDSLTDDLGVQELTTTQSASRDRRLGNHQQIAQRKELGRQGREKIVHTKRTVISGGIMKPRKQRGIQNKKGTDAVAAFAVRPANLLPDRRSPTKLLETRDDEDGTTKNNNPDSSVGSITLGGVAERLLMYSQNLVTSYSVIVGDDPVASNSGEMLSSSNTNTTATERTTTSSTTASTAYIANNDRRPLTLSQLSPLKKISSSSETTSNIPNNIMEIAPMSPIRWSTKRPAEEEEEEEEEALDGCSSRKKGKFTLSPPPTPTPTLAAPAPAAAPLIAASTTAITNKESELTHSAEQAPAGKVTRHIASGSRSKMNVIIKKKQQQQQIKVLTRGKTHAKGLGTMRPVNKAGNSHTERDKRVPNPTRTPTTTAVTATTAVTTTATSSDSLLQASSSKSSSKPISVVINSSRGTELQHRLKNRGKIESVVGPSTSLLLQRREEEEEQDRDRNRNQKLELGEKFGNGATSTKHVMGATIPYEFKFTSDARLEARKHSVVCGKKQQQHHPVPDFKPIHASIHEAAAAAVPTHHHHHKENLVLPAVVPGRPTINYKRRMEERRKFDEGVREREKEREREMEEMKRREEEEEEREVREMRKRAVPRANEVPEWYRDAPRKR